MSQRGWEDFYLNTYSTIIAQAIEKIKVDIVAQTLEQLKIDIASQSLSQLNVNIAGQTVTLEVKGNVNANITNSSLNVNVTNSSLNVNVQGTADVNIAQASVDLNVKQETKLGNFFRLRCFNIGAGDTDIDIYSDEWGLYIPRGCRGYIYRVSPIVKNTSSADRNITIKLSIAPGSPPLVQTTITVSASQTSYAIVNYTPRIVWNYDSIYISVKADGDGVYLEGLSSKWGCGGFKNTTPQTILPNFELIFLAKPVGDIPVSGTVNTIQIPNTVTSGGLTAYYIDPGDSKTLKWEKVGRVQFMLMRFEGVVATNIFVAIYCDDELVWAGHLSELYEVLGSTICCGGKMRFQEYDDTNKNYTFILEDVFGFKRKFELRVENNDSADRLVFGILPIIEHIA